MTDAELIARQAKLIEEMRDKIAELHEGIRKACLHIVCIGGPLNDNKLHYSKEQLVIFQRILWKGMIFFQISPKE
jgi:hypothetical protein